MIQKAAAFVSALIAAKLHRTLWVCVTVFIFNKTYYFRQPSGFCGCSNTFNHMTICVFLEWSKVDKLKAKGFTPRLHLYLALSTCNRILRTNFNIRCKQSPTNKKVQLNISVEQAELPEWNPRNAFDLHYPWSAMLNTAAPWMRIQPLWHRHMQSLWF